MTKIKHSRQTFSRICKICSISQILSPLQCRLENIFVKIPTFGIGLGMSNPRHSMPLINFSRTSQVSLYHTWQKCYPQQWLHQNQSQLALPTIEALQDAPQESVVVVTDCPMRVQDLVPNKNNKFESYSNSLVYVFGYMWAIIQI